MDGTERVRIALAGDVMTGRGIDQILPHPAEPVIYERWVGDARRYVRLAEEANGHIPQPVSPDYVWGVVLAELTRTSPDVRIANLETSLTCSEDFWPDKGINYRMSPRNVPCLTAAGLDVCSLANNHVLDWGREGLFETLRVLEGAGIAHAGAGPDLPAARAPAIVEVAGRGRVIVAAAATHDSGVPTAWEATADRPGIVLLPDLSPRTARELAGSVRELARPDDLVVMSLHWGGNWGHWISPEQVAFAHRLVDEGVDIVHGHSSHHPKALEVYHHRLILHGCGDLLNDYEGIGGHQEHRGDLGVLYIVDVSPGEGRLLGVELVPVRSRRFRLETVSDADRRWLVDRLNLVGRRFGTRLETRGGRLELIFDLATRSPAA